MSASGTLFRPCIDLHLGKVKQIVGGSLNDASTDTLRTNFESDKPASYFAEKYRQDGLRGGHVIMLGPGNVDAALDAIHAYPGGLQVGGGIRLSNAKTFLSAGAEAVIVTTHVFDDDAVFQEEKLQVLSELTGPENLVLDLSCRRHGSGWNVAMNRWQTPTDLEVSHETLDRLAPYCREFLIHAADVEGLCKGIDEELVTLLGSWGKLTITYAGGARSLSDLDLVQNLSGGSVDLAIGSALDIFGGTLVRYEDCVAYNRSRQSA